MSPLFRDRSRLQSSRLCSMLCVVWLAMSCWPSGIAKRRMTECVTINTDQAAIWLGSVLTVKLNGSDVSELFNMGKASSIFDRDFEKGVFDNPLRLRTTAIYPTKTPGVWYQLHESLHADPVLRAIGVDPATKCESPAEAYSIIREQIQDFSADELEMIMVKNGFCGSICHTPKGWSETLMGKRLESHPLINYSHESYAVPTPPVPLPVSLEDKRPLAGIKVVELVRIIADPVIGTTLAAFGAEVIRVNYSKLPDINALQLTLNAGVRTVDLDASGIARHSKEVLIDKGTWAVNLGTRDSLVGCRHLGLISQLRSR